MKYLICVDEHLFNMNDILYIKQSEDGEHIYVHFKDNKDVLYLKGSLKSVINVVKLLIEEEKENGK